MRTACSVNVPNGPKKPTRADGRGVLGAGRSVMAGRLLAAAARRPRWRSAGSSGSMARWTNRRCGRCSTTSPPGASTPTTSSRRLRRLPFADVGDALVDHHRALRQGMPEAVYGPGKTPEQCVRIVGELLAHGTGPVLLTRASDDQAKAVVAEHGPARHERRLPAVPGAGDRRRTGDVLVVAAGTADRPVADECLLTLRGPRLRARPARRRRRRRAAPAARPPRRGHRGRRRRRARRHGGRAGQRRSAG